MHWLSRNVHVLTPFLPWCIPAHDPSPPPPTKNKVGTIYLLAGVFGTIASAIFVPTQVMVGASGAIFGVFGAMWADLWQNWSINQNRCWMFTVLLILTGELTAVVVLGSLVATAVVLGGGHPKKSGSDACGGGSGAFVRAAAAAVEGCFAVPLFFLFRVQIMGGIVCSSFKRRQHSNAAAAFLFALGLAWLD